MGGVGAVEGAGDDEDATGVGEEQGGDFQEAREWEGGHE